MVLTTSSSQETAVKSQLVLQLVNPDLRIPRIKMPGLFENQFVQGDQEL